MIDRDKIIRYYRSSGDDALAARLLDLAELAVKLRRYKVSEFVDPYGLSIAETIGKHFATLSVDSDGGYPTAERVKVAFVNEELFGYPDYQIKALALNWDHRFYSLSHRDVLGALIGLGCKREVIGDIIISNDECNVVVEFVMADFIQNNLTKIGSAAVTVKEISLEDIKQKEEKTKQIKTTVASMRLDVIAAAGFGVSRSRMAGDITAEKIKVNWQDAKNAAQSIKAGDIISLRGRGRVEVCEVLGTTKKGRTSVLLKRYM